MKTHSFVSFFKCWFGLDFGFVLFAFVLFFSNLGLDCFFSNWRLDWVLLSFYCFIEVACKPCHKSIPFSRFINMFFCYQSSLSTVHLLLSCSAAARHFQFDASGQWLITANQESLLCLHHLFYCHRKTRSLINMYITLYPQDLCSQSGVIHHMAIFSCFPSHFPEWPDES